MRNRKRILLILALFVLVSGLGIVYYMFNMPHRDVKSSKEDFILDATTIVAEYLKDAEKANQKYLAEDGDSKIIIVSGVVSDISDDAQNNKVILLKKEGEKAGVSCTMLHEEKNKISSLKVGTLVKIKGVIQSGASFDEDLGLYENVILNKCTIIN